MIDKKTVGGFDRTYLLCKLFKICLIIICRIDCGNSLSSLYNYRVMDFLVPLQIYYIIHTII